MYSGTESCCLIGVFSRDSYVLGLSSEADIPKCLKRLLRGLRCELEKQTVRENFKWYTRKQSSYFLTEGQAEKGQS